MMTQEQLPVHIAGSHEYQVNLLENSATWLKAMRQRATASIAQLQIPTVKDEEFKYTSLNEISNTTFYLPSRYTFANPEKLWKYASKADINIILVNGKISQELSNLENLPKGLTINTLMEAAHNNPAEVEATVSKITTNDSKALLFLNHAFFLEGVFIKVVDKAVIEPLIHIIHVTSGIKDHTVVFPRLLVHVGNGAQVSILESHISYDNNPYWSNSVMDMRVGENANVQYCKSQSEGPHAILTASSRIWQEKNSQCDMFTLVHGGKLVRNNLTILLKGEGANTIMNSFYALDGQQHVDNHTLLDIQQPNCTSYQLYKGILNDQSRAVFNGKIYVHPIAQKTNGYQLNKHLLLGKEARIDTKPELEIFADDVKCTHGATIGQLNEEEIFYLQSRCIKKDTAISLLSKGFIDDIMSTVKNISIRNKLNFLLSEKFPEVKL